LKYTGTSTTVGGFAAGFGLLVTVLELVTGRVLLSGFGAGAGAFVAFAASWLAASLAAFVAASRSGIPVGLAAVLDT
jgi:hypothetical protein